MYHMICLLRLYVAVAMENTILSSFELTGFSTKTKLPVVDFECHNGVGTPKSATRNY